MYFEKPKDRTGWPIIRSLGIVTRTIESNIHCQSYNYDVRRKFHSAKKQMEAAYFAEENFKGDWLIGCDRSGFENEEEAMIFKLTFL